jgi:hypothetical protein
MPPGFLPALRGNDAQFWIPLRWDPPTKYSFLSWENAVYARLNDGVSVEQAQVEMDNVTAQMRIAHPHGFTWGAVVAPLDAYLF